MKHILVATDLSDRSDPALTRAFELANFHAAGLTILHAIDADLPSDMRAEMERMSAEKLDRRAKAMAERFPCSYDLRIAQGDAADAARLQAMSTNTDLIVLGLHRPRAFFDGFRETTMERIVRTSEVPVLLSVNEPKGDYARVLCPVDFSPASARAVATARTLLPDAEYRLFHAFHMPHPLHGSSDDGDLPFRKMVAAEYGVWVTMNDGVKDLGQPDVIEGSITAAAAREITAFKPDLMVIGAHSRGRLQRVSLGSFAKDMIRNPPLDLLISHP